MHRPLHRIVPGRSALALAAACGLCAGVGGLGGCNNGNHGKYTSEHIEVAKERMSLLKSGSEWQMAQQQFLAGDLDKALKTVDRSIGLNEKVPKSHVLRGRILIEKGRLEDARASFLKAEELDPNFVEAQYYLGIVHERFQQPEEALARYQKAIALDEANPQYVIAAAEMLVAQGRLDEAEALINDKKATFQYNAAVRQTLGHISMLRNDPKAAAVLFDEALLLAPDDANILEDLVQAHMGAGNFAEAEFNINRLLDTESGKGRRDLLQLRARCLMSLNRPVEARQLLTELTSDKEAGRDYKVWVDLGNVATVLKDRANLRLAAGRVIALAPDRHEGYVLRAMFFRLEGKSAEALTALDSATVRCGTDTGPFVLRALILQDCGRPVEARQTLTEALARNPDDQRSQRMLRVLQSDVASHPDAGD